MMNAMNMDDLTEIGEVLNSTLVKFVNFSGNDYVNSGSAHDLMVNWVQWLFLKSKFATSKADNPNCWQAINGPFSDEYWKAAFKYIETL